MPKFTIPSPAPAPANSLRPLSWQDVEGGTPLRKQGADLDVEITLVPMEPESLAALDVPSPSDLESWGDDWPAGEGPERKLKHRRRSTKCNKPDRRACDERRVIGAWWSAFAPQNRRQIRGK
jgi:hypothetical protein